jgi:thymidylate kinase
VSLFITFEGIEAWQVVARATLAETWSAGRVVVEIREPGGTPAGAAIRAPLSRSRR